MPVFRRCGTCVHHVTGVNRCSGQCNHPARRTEGGVALLIRSAELACRTSWGSDLWEPRPQNFSIELNVWGPFAAETPLDDYPADLLRLLLRPDEA